MRRLVALPLLLLAFSASLLAAEDPCRNFKWDVSNEVKLFQQVPVAVAAGNRIDAAPRVEVNQLYEATLPAQSTLAFPAPPTKRMLDDGAHAGLFRLRVAAAGEYRIAIDSGFWLDVIEGSKPLASTDFNGSTACAGPRKIVVYALPAGTELFVQFSAVNAAKARFTITRVAAGGT